MQKKYLMTPGPTPVPAEIMLAMAAPMIHHRTPDFSAAFKAAIDNLKYVFQTQGDVLLFACSGTGVMEASIANCFSAGDTAIVCRNGKFGDRQKQICETYGVNVVDLAYEWTQVVDPADIATALAENPGVRGVIVTQSETSSGVLNDVQAIGAIVREYPDTVLIVDSITGIGAVECKTDEWGLDVVMTGSQKGLMLPPGLAACTVSEKAWRAYERSNLPKYYFDWMKYKKNVEKDTTPFTPAVSLVLGLNQALAMIREEGISNTIARHGRLAEATRKGCEALGLKLFAPPEGRGSAVTPVWVPGGRRRQGDRQDDEGQVRRHHRRWSGRLRGAHLPHRPPGLLRRVRHHHHARRARDDACGPWLRLRTRSGHQRRRVSIHGRVGDS